MLSLDEAAKLAQSAFYVVGGVVAILTYRSAKRGLLNTVNTEYQKRVMDRLHSLCEELHAEFDPESPAYWGKEDPLNPVVAEINSTFTANREGILKTGVFEDGILVSADWSRLHRLLNKIKSDPFIPKQVRDRVVDLLEARVSTLSDAYGEVMEDYMQSLAQGRHIDTLDDNRHWLHNNINKLCYERGCGVSQIEEEVHDIRLFVQRYLESFNPLA